MSGGIDSDFIYLTYYDHNMQKQNMIVNVRSLLLRSYMIAVVTGMYTVKK